MTNPPKIAPRLLPLPPTITIIQIINVNRSGLYPDGVNKPSRVTSIAPATPTMAIVGVAGAMLVTLDGLFTPSGYRPLRFTFIIWIMVIVGGSGNNLGAIFGGFVIWFAWIEVAPLTTFLINLFTSGLDPQNAIRLHLLDSVPYFRYLLMGMVLLLILRYRPKGIIPEKVRHS